MSSHMTPGQTCAAHACIGCTSPGLQHPFCHKREPNTFCGIGSSLNKNTETVGSCCTTVGWEDPPIYNKYPRCYHRERSRKQPESRPTQLVFSISGHEKSTPGCGSPDGSASDNELPKSVLELHTISFIASALNVSHSEDTCTYWA